MSACTEWANVDNHDAAVRAVLVAVAYRIATEPDLIAALDEILSDHALMARHMRGTDSTRAYLATMVTEYTEQADAYAAATLTGNLADMARAKVTAYADALRVVEIGAEYAGTPD